MGQQSVLEVLLYDNVEEMGRNLVLIYINQPGVKLVSFCVVSLKVIEPTDNVR